MSTLQTFAVWDISIINLFWCSKKKNKQKKPRVIFVKLSYLHTCKTVRREFLTCFKVYQDIILSAQGGVPRQPPPSSPPRRLTTEESSPAVPELPSLAPQWVAGRLEWVAQPPALLAEVDEQKSVLELGVKYPQDQLWKTAVTITQAVLHKLRGEGGRPADSQAVLGGAAFSKQFLCSELAHLCNLSTPLSHGSQICLCFSVFKNF